MVWNGRAPPGGSWSCEEGDITRVAADAMVNAANSALAGGGGVDGAIHRAGGPEIMRELDAIRRAIGRCPTGSAVATGAGLLPAQYVFHAVGPVYRDGRHGEPELLAVVLPQMPRTGRRARRANHQLPGHQHGSIRLPAGGRRRDRHSRSARASGEAG